jgi:hypothetical protein
VPGSSRPDEPIPNTQGNLFQWDTVTVPVLNIRLPANGWLRVSDSASTDGLLLTGTLMRDYGLMGAQKRQHEDEIAMYKKALDTMQRMSANCDTALSFVDRRIAYLMDINRLSAQRGDLYKAIADAKGDNWIEAIWKRIAFPAGLVAGIFIGVVITK